MPGILLCDWSVARDEFVDKIESEGTGADDETYRLAMSAVEHTVITPSHMYLESVFYYLADVSIAVIATVKMLLPHGVESVDDVELVVKYCHC